MKKTYIKPLVVKKEVQKTTPKSVKPMYLADGRWCCVSSELF